MSNQRLFLPLTILYITQTKASNSLLNKSKNVDQLLRVAYHGSLSDNSN